MSRGAPNVDGREGGSGLSASGPPASAAPAVPLARLLSVVEGVHLVGDPTDVVVRGVTFHTGQVRKDVLHCCLPGSRVDGHDLAGEAVAAGAAALLCERPLQVGAVQLVVAPGRARPVMAQLAADYWGYPARALRMVGVTGTNGKTTVVHLLRAILSAHGWRTAALGTLDGPRTTPEAPLLQEELAHQVRDQTKVVAMEVTSHALVQHRVDGIRFGCAVFTNLSRDHLDFHHSMESYYEAKASLFTAERAEVGVAGADDPWGRRLLHEAPVPMEPFSLSEAAGVELGPFGARFRWRGHPVHLRLHGCFNVANALAAAHAAGRLGVPEATVAAGLSALDGVPGRYEGVDEGQPFRLVVDYAHTPAALAAVLAAARIDAGRPQVGKVDHGARGRVIVVFGCGGDRDRSKRPVMAEVATRLADLTVLTSDNPRSEDPRAIIEEIKTGVRPGSELVVEPDRAAAIDWSVGAARPGDVVVLAGKGHERRQETAAGSVEFDDREVAREAIARLLGSRA